MSRNLYKFFSVFINVFEEVWDEMVHGSPACQQDHNSFDRTKRLRIFPLENIYGTKIEAI